MKPKRNIVAIENMLEAAQGGIALYRQGVNEFFLSHGFPLYFEKLEAARRDLESLGMYQLCRDALEQAEVLVKQGPENDERAAGLVLEANRSLMRASGSYEAMKLRWNAANDSGHSAD